MQHKLWITFFPLLWSCSNTSNHSQENSLAIEKNLDSYISQAQKAFGVPSGIAVAVYTPDGSYVRGFGVTDIETGEAVTPDTAFYIASSTKSFLALAMNNLHHRGDIDLNAPLSEYAPEANFPAALSPSEVTLQDLLTHTAGIKNNPIVLRTAYSGEHTPDILWRLLSTSTVNQDSPHGTFEYTNVGYNILTILTDRELGIPWQDIVNQEIIRPLGLNRTTAYMSKTKREGWSLARPHASTPDGNGLQRLYLEKTDATMQSAGGMVMSANDALLWLELLVNDGRVNGEQLIPADVVTETRQRLAKVEHQFGDYYREGYGLGWYISSYRDNLMIHHFGGFSGFRAHVSYLPEHKVGVAVFSNNLVVGSFFVDSIANYAYDLLTGREEADLDLDARIADLSVQYQNLLVRLRESTAKRGAREWALRQPLTAYTGTFHSEELGTLTISLQNESLMAKLGVMHATAEPFTRPESIRVEFAPFQGELIQFELEDGIAMTASTSDGTFHRVQ